MTFTGLSGVPDYRIDSYQDKKSEYCLLIPVINEGVRILKELQRAQKAGVDKLCDILICDGGSTDGSMEPERLKKLGVNGLLTKLGPGRQGAQLRMGISYALGRGYAGVLTIDGNNKDSIESVPLFIKKLREGYDLVQGSRAPHPCPPDQPGGRPEIHRYHQRLPGLQPGLSDSSPGTAFAG